MKVVQINTFPYKAAGSIMMNIHHYLLGHGIDSYVVWGRGRESKTDHEYYMNDKPGVYLHALETRLTDKSGFYSTSATKALIKWLETIKPNIIHLHCIHGYYLNIELLFDYFARSDAKVIWTQHDCWAFTGHCAYFDMIGCQKWKTGCHDCKQLNTYPASLHDGSKWNWNKKRELFTSVPVHIVTPCNWLKDIVQNSFLRKNEVSVIYNGIDTNIFREIKTKKSNKRIILGVASEWTKRKGLDDFIHLNNMLDKSAYEIILAGLTKKQIATLPEGIKGLERTSNVEELVRLYNAASVFFNPTYEDNFPTTNLEALACGTPVITYRTGGSPESVIEGKNGYVVDKGDYQKAYDLMGKMNKNIISFDKNLFSKEAMIRKYIDIYE